MQIFWLQLREEMRSSFPNYWAVSTAYQQESGMGHYLSSSSVGRCLLPPKACSSRPSEAGSLAVLFTLLSWQLWHLYHWAWTVLCYQWRPKPFLVVSNNELHKGMAGRKVAKRWGWCEKIKKSYALLKKSEIGPAHLASTPPQKFLYRHLKKGIS